jgi:hypothetical protein
VNRRDYAIANRVRSVDLTPWARAAVGDTSGWVLPPGYRIMGSARYSKGPIRLELHRPIEPTEYSSAGLIEQRFSSIRDARDTFGQLVEAAWVHGNAPRCVLCHRVIDERTDAPAITVRVGEGTGSLCSRCQDKHLHDEPRYVVTVGPGDYIESIEDTDG